MAKDNDMPKELTPLPEMIFVTEGVTQNSLPRRGYWVEHSDGVEGTPYAPASHSTALQERLDRAEALLKETVPIIMRDTECDHDQEGCRVCADNADLISRIAAFTQQNPLSAFISAVTQEKTK